MGREVYLMRLALGRSALEPPEDSQTFTASRAGEWSSALHPAGVPELTEAEARASSETPPHGVQLFEARGHPVNPWARRLARKLREAQNDILSVIGVTERKNPVDYGYDSAGEGYQVAGHHVEPDEDEVGWKVGVTADIDYQFLSWWIHALVNRLLVFPPTQDILFVELVRSQSRALGWPTFMFAGLPSFLIEHLVSPEMLTSLLLDYIDREVWATISSRRTREAYERYRFALAGGIEVFLNIFILPFRIHTMLQILGFAPHSIWQLPSPSLWIPFREGSFLQRDTKLMPLIPFFIFRPISSLTHQYLFKSCRPAIRSPAEAAHRRRSSSQRLAASVTAAPLIELPHEDTTLTPLFHMLFGFLGWGRPSLEKRSVTVPFQPSFGRRETWPADHGSGAASSTNATRTAETSGQPTLEREAVARNVEAAHPPTPRLERTQTSATLDGGSPLDRDHDHASDATIRVSSIGPDGAVNLEIGLPEETLFERESATANDPTDDLNGSETALGAHSGLRRRNDDADAYYVPHHISRLALEPTELLTSMANGWVAGWLLMPLRVVVLRSLAGHIMAHPTLFGVDPSRALALPHLLGSDVSVLGSRGMATGGIKYVALGCLLDVSLGLGYWLAEWVIVRSIGIGDYGWGKF